MIAGPRIPKQCNDGIDNDGDTYVDLQDPGCSSRRDNNERGTIPCDDGIDNDGDTRIDYPNDAGCTSPLDNNELGTVECDDGVDNGDADTLKDYPNDLGCISPSDSNEVDGACDDLTDNDNDTTTDYPSDPGCTSFSDASELGLVQCNDGIDNDGDSSIDYPDDLGCTNPIDTSEIGPTPVQCSDGIDNDGDTKIDFGTNQFTSDSKCIDATDTDESPRDSCTDSEGSPHSINSGIQGTISGDDESVPFSFTDACIDSLNMKEYYCGDKSEDYRPFNITVSCQNTTTCISGACV